MSHDESLHALFSFNLAKDLSYSHDPMTHGPFLFHADGLIFRLFGASDFTARVLPALAGVVLCATPLFLRRQLGRVGSLAAGLMLAISPSMVFYSRYIRNDIYMCLWSMLWICGGLSWAGAAGPERRTRHLVWASAGLILAFATKETAFILGTIYGPFMLALPHLEPRRGHRPYLDHPAVSYALFMLLLILPFLAAFTQALLGLDPALFTGPGLYPALRLTSLMMVFAVFLSWLWLNSGHSRITPARWWTILVVAWVVWAGLYTTLFTHLPGLASGFEGSLGYWMGQHGVARGGQPWFYYPMLVLLYETAPLLASLAGLFLIRRGGTLQALLIWWISAAFVLFTVAGEKMPWLLTYMVLPMSLLGGMWISQAAQNIRPLRPAVALLILWVVMLGLDARSSYRLNFVNYDLAVEPLVYAHGTPDIKPALARIRDLAARHPGLRVVYDDESSWPLAWYFRDMPYVTLYGNAPTAADLTAGVVLAGPKNVDHVRQALSLTHEVTTCRLIWWPDESYKNDSPMDLLRMLADPEKRSALAGFWLDRTWPGVSTDNWPLRKEFDMWVRRDLR